jgi:vacuolar-type H+-ATPase subunit D/Vma8
MKTLKLKRKLNRLTQFQKLLKIAKKMFQMNKRTIISNATIVTRDRTGLAAFQALKD